MTLLNEPEADDALLALDRALVEAVIEEARAVGRPAVALTFEPHPRAFFAPDAPMFRLTGPAAKERVFRRLGLDGLIVRRFDAGLAATSARAEPSGSTGSSAISSAATFEPWPTSVIAKQPMSLPLMMSGTYAARCLSVPRRETAPPNRPNWTPFLMSSDRSP